MRDKKTAVFAKKLYWDDYWHHPDGPHSQHFIRKATGKVPTSGLQNWLDSFANWDCGYHAKAKNRTERHKIRAILKDSGNYEDPYVPSSPQIWRHEINCKTNKAHKNWIASFRGCTLSDLRAAICKHTAKKSRARRIALDELLPHRDNTEPTELHFRQRSSLRLAVDENEQIIVNNWRDYEKEYYEFIAWSQYRVLVKKGDKYHWGNLEVVETPWGKYDGKDYRYPYIVGKELNSEELTKLAQFKSLMRIY